MAGIVRGGTAGAGGRPGAPARRTRRVGDQGGHEKADGLNASPGISIRRATPDDAAGIAAVLNGVIAGGRHSLLDTPFTVDEERAYLEALPERSFLHVAEVTDLRADNLDSLGYHLALGFTIVGAARRQARVAGRDIDVIFIERFLKG